MKPTRQRLALEFALLACCWTWLAAPAIGAESLSGTQWLIPGDEGGGMAMMSQTGDVVRLKADLGCGPHNLLAGKITPVPGGGHAATISGQMIRCTNPELISNCSHAPKYAVDFTGTIVVIPEIGTRILTVQYEMQIWNPVDCRFVRDEKRTDTYVEFGITFLPQRRGGVVWTEGNDSVSGGPTLNESLDRYLPLSGDRWPSLRRTHP